MRAALVLAVALTMALPGLAADNLAPNASFEEAAPDRPSPPGWNAWGGANLPANVARDTSYARTGRASLHVTDPETQANWYAASDYIAIDPTRHYYLSVWARGAAPRRGQMRFDMLDADRVFLTSVSLSIEIDPEWRPFALVVSQPHARAAFAQVSLAATEAYEETGEAWFDDVELCALTEDGALEPGGEPVVREQILEPDAATWTPFPIPLLDPGEPDGAPSALDCSDLVEAPAGKHGFLNVDADGHFRFDDGARARFFATNIHASNACFPTHEQAESFARRMRRQGVNMVRTHLLEYDAPGGLIAGGDQSRELDPEQLDRFCYLLNQFRLNGIYVIPDVHPMCARRIRSGDGVPGFDGSTLGAKGVSQFAAPVIDLERDYARRLLLHRNPYSGLRLIDDPTIALVEMTNEDHLFLAGQWFELPPPYAAELVARWNRWLLERYGGRERLARAWTDADGVCALGAGEDPAAGTVEGGLMPYVSTWSRENTGPSAPSRVNDTSRFLFAMQRGYYEEQARWLRDLGLRCPITGSNIASGEAVLFATTALDFTDNHAYWDHPQYEDGVERRLHNGPLVREDPLGRPGLVNTLAVAKVAGKPLIATEWNSLWPNQWRGADVLSTTAYACLQDWDAIFLYSYHGGWGLGFDDAGPLIPHATVIYADPAEAGLLPTAARMFLRHDVRAAQSLFEVGISDDDTHFSQYYGSDPGGPLAWLPYVARVQKRFFSDVYEPSAGVSATVVSGNTASGDYRAADHLVLSVRNSWVSTALAERDRARSARSREPGLRFVPAGGALLALPTPAGGVQPTRLKAGEPLVDAASLPAGAAPLVATMDGGACVGYIGTHDLIAPSLPALGGDAPRVLAGAVTEAAQGWGLWPVEAGYFPGREAVVSDTGELSSEWGRGVFTVNTPATQIAAGFLGSAGAVELADVAIRCRTPFATISVTSADGLPIARSSRLLVSAVGRAENAGQRLRQTVLRVGDSFVPQGDVTVESVGRAPVLLEPTEAEVVIARGDAATVWALGPDGARLREVACERAGGRLVVPLGAAWRTMYYEVSFGRP